MKTHAQVQRRTTTESSDRLVANLQTRAKDDRHSEQPLPPAVDFSHVDLFSHAPQRRSVQAKLTVGAPNDVYEQEADRVAEQVMNIPDSATHQSIQREDATEESAVQTKPLAVTITPIVQREMELEEKEDPEAVQAKLIQREEALEEDDEAHKPVQAKLIQREEALEEDDEAHKPVQAKSELQRKASPAGFQAQPRLEQQLDSSKGGGSPLPDNVRAFMEPRFGADFSQVRVHTGSEAVQMNQDLSAQAFTHQQHVYFGSGKAPAKDALTAHELTHVVQQSGVVNQKSIQRAATTVVQRDRTSDQLKSLETRTKILENKTAANQLDLKHRALFGARISTYKQIVYRLTGAFQSALSGYQGAHGKQAAHDAVIDQIAATLILVGGAAFLEPFLSAGLGKLQSSLSKTSEAIAAVNIGKAVEKLENPINVAASGAGNTATTKLAGDRAANAPQASGAPAGVGGDSSISYLASNMEAIEMHTQKFEEAFSKRETQYETLTLEQWGTWSKETQETEYSKLLRSLDSVALGDIAKLEGAQTLAVKIELYLWANWIKTQITPGVRGLQLGGPLAKRLKELGVESLANVKFDTKSWVFMEHEPHGKWQSNLHVWALGWSQPVTK